MNVSLYQAAAALNASTRWQEVIGENLASSSMHGYKRQDISFAAVQAGYLPKLAGGMGGDPKRFELTRADATTNFTPGELNYTGEKFDMALEGRGFFQIQLPSGQTAFTRNGAFTMNAEGMLVTKSGYLVLGTDGPIRLNPKNVTDPAVIGRGGDVRQGAEIRGKIRVVDFDNPRDLVTTDSSNFMAVKPTTIPKDVETPTLRQGMLEASNASAVHEMASLIMAMRLYEANQKVIHTHDERMTRSINELANPASS